MTTEVKGLKVGDGVVACTFNINDLPPEGGFKGIIVDFKVTEIISDTSVKLTKAKDENQSIVFDFKDDSPNAFYTGDEKGDNYTGIFTDVRLMFDQYKEIYAKARGSYPEKKI